MWEEPDFSSALISLQQGDSDATGIATPNRKGSRYISFNCKTTFWCPNIWHPLETNPPNLQRLLYVIKMLTYFSSFLALSILHLSVYHEET